MARYKDLDPLLKVEVVQRWVHFCIDRGWSATGIRLPRPILENFYYTNCRDLQMGTKQHAMRHAKFCWYCKERLGPPNLNGRPNELRQPTIDHFFAKGHQYRGRPVFIVSCYACNVWKGDKRPEDLLTLIVTNVQRPKGWNKETYDRIRKVLSEFHGGKNPEGYYISDKNYRV